MEWCECGMQLTRHAAAFHDRCTRCGCDGTQHAIDQQTFGMCFTGDCPCPNFQPPRQRRNQAVQPRYGEA